MQTPASCVAALALALIYEASASNWTQFSIASPVPHGPGQSVLVNTPGGSGSTLVMSRLREAGTSINSPYNEDTLKHKSAAALASLLQQRVIAKVYDRVLIVVNRDMARAVASTVERFALQHYILGLLPGCTDCYNCNCWGGNRKRSARERNQLKTPPSWRGKKGAALLRAIYASAAQAGRDTYGVGFHFDSWSHAQRYEAARWPPILFLDVAAFVDPSFSCILRAFLGRNDTAFIQRLRAPVTANLERTWHHAAKHLDAQSLMTNASRMVYKALSARVAEVLDENYAYYAQAFKCPSNREHGRGPLPEDPGRPKPGGLLRPRR